MMVLCGLSENYCKGRPDLDPDTGQQAACIGSEQRAGQVDHPGVAAAGILAVIGFAFAFAETGAGIGQTDVQALPRADSVTSRKTGGSSGHWRPGSGS